MSYRRGIEGSRDAVVRKLADRVSKQEKGAQLAGRASFGSRIRLGGKDLPVDVEVVPLGGGSVQIIFRNIATGAESTINL